MNEIMAGGCQCGRVRYSVTVGNDEAYLCHCRMCQRATGGVAAALKEVPRDAVRWQGVEPERYVSSPIAERGFCNQCGTPLTYEGKGSDHIDLTVGSFDEPHRLHPTSHAGVESWHEEWLDTKGLPTMRTDQLPNIVGKWMNTVGKLPD